MKRLGSRRTRDVIAKVAPPRVNSESSVSRSVDELAEAINRIRSRLIEIGDDISDLADSVADLEGGGGGGSLPDMSTDRLLGRDTAGTGAYEELTVGQGLEFTGSGGIRRQALTGDVTAAAGDNATTIANNAVTNAKLRDSLALSVIGRSANSTGDPADIEASSDGDVLRRSGTALGFGAIPQASVTNLVADLSGKQDADSDLTAIAGLSTTGLIDRTGTGTATTRSVGAASGSDILDRDAGDARYFQQGQNQGPGRIHPSNCSHTSTVRATSSTTAYAVYMGRAPFELSSLTVYYSVTTAASGTVTYAEWAVATGTPTQASDPSLTLPSQTVGDVSAQYTSTGSYTCTITPTAPIAAGTDIWLVFGSQQTSQAPVIRAHTAGNPHDLGESATRTSFQPSANTGSAFTFTRDTTAAQMWPVIRA